MLMHSEKPYWKDPEVVRRFAGRDPDHRLRALVEEIPEPEAFRVLDLGCAGGRNTVFLANLGFDVFAIDASREMVDETQRGLSAILGQEKSRARVKHGLMEDLSFLSTGSVDLVLALGILQHAESMDEWHRTVGEVSRILRVGGRCLVAHFTPAVDLTGEGITPVPGEPHVYTGMPGESRAILLNATELDREMGNHGFRPVTESQTVTVVTDPGQRVTVNGHFEKS
jgi:SAM-dependent methyltransferase